jgi:hypothetical protein
MTNNNNGRINFNYPSTSSLFELYDKTPSHQCITYRKPISTQTSTILTKTFFSNQNIKLVNNAIRRGVYDSTNKQYLISEQDCTTILIIMKSIFLTHSKNNLNNITNQISELNKLVIEYCVKQIIGEAKSYMKYITDISELPTPLDYPKMTNTKHNQLERKILF